MRRTFLNCFAIIAAAALLDANPALAQMMPGGPGGAGGMGGMGGRNIGAG